MSAIKAVLMDIDGTLVDTNDAHAKAWVDALAEGGYNVPYGAVRPLIGMGSDQLLPRVVKVEGESPEGQALSEAWKRIFQHDYLPHVQVLPGATDLLKALHAKGLRVVAASSGAGEIADALLALVNASDCFCAKTTADDAKKSKPEPDLLHAALKKAGTHPEAAVLIGDTPYDIEAARAAGIGVIALRSGGFSDADLSGALAVYDDPADLLKNLASVPIFT